MKKNNDEVLDEEVAALDLKETDSSFLASGLTEYRGFKLFFRRNLVKLQQKLFLIPLLIVTLSMIVLYIGMYFFANAITALPSENLQGFFFFILTLISVLNCLVYGLANGKKKKLWMRIFFFVLFVSFIALQLAIDIDYLTVINKMIANGSFSETKKLAVSISKAYSIIHIIFLGISLVLGLVLPLLQKKFSGYLKNKRTSNITR